MRDSVDVFEPRRALRTLAARLGFPRAACQELEIVISELCSNIVKYGIPGRIELRGLKDPTHGVAVSIVAFDHGPPIQDLASALKDGCDDRGPIDPMLLLKRRGLGAGLGAIVRLTDSFQVDQGPGEKRIAVIRYLKRPRR